MILNSSCSTATTSLAHKTTERPFILTFVIAILTKHNHTVDLTLNFYQGKITQFFFLKGGFSLAVYVSSIF